MSENIVIQEGGIGKQLAADKLKVNKAGGGTCLYVLEGSTVLGTKNITANGSYSAEDDGYVGYSQVYVNVSDGGGGGGGGGSIVGRDSDGNEAVVTTDPDTEAFIITKIPSSIRVTTPPTNPYGTYIDGQTITKDGMVVKAYDANGEEMQTVPIGEITINPTTASIDESEIRGGGNIEGIPIINIALETAEYSVAVPSEFTVGNVTFKGESASPAYGDHFALEANGTTYGWYYSKNSFPIKVKLQASGNVADPQIFTRVTAANGEALPSSGDLSSFRYTPGLPEYYQTITVSWSRPGDNKALEASFTITVGPRAGQGDD